MDDALKDLFDSNTDLKHAREVAEKIASLVGSQAVANAQIVVNEPYCPFKVPFHNKQFHCFFWVSDAGYCFTAKRRPKTPWAEDFAVGIKEPYYSKGASILSPELSQLVGVSVFRQRICADDVVDVAFSSELLNLFAKVQFNRVRRMAFSPTALQVVASLDTPEFCVNQASYFRELVTCANRDAYQRNKKFLG
jgi:hypothetical protein